MKQFYPVIVFYEQAEVDLCCIEPYSFSDAAAPRQPWNRFRGTIDRHAH
ncbi:MAG: hypothetical protein WA973_10245 [Mesorhizobium sp.]